MKETYVVRGWYQHLLSGTWNAPDQEWEWRYQDNKFDSLEQAQFVFNSVKCTKDFPRYDLIKETLNFNHSAYYMDSEILESKDE